MNLKRKKKKEKNLDGRQVLLIECSSVVIYIISQTAANISFLQTILDLFPILLIHQMILQPVRIISKPVLLIPAIRYRLPHALIGDDEREYGEDEDR